MGLELLRQIRSQRRGTTQVDVAHILAGLVGLGMREQANDPRHRSGHRDLGRAEQRHVGQPHLAGGVGGELGGEPVVSAPPLRLPSR